MNRFSWFVKGHNHVACCLPLLLLLGLKAKRCGVGMPKLIQDLCFQNLQVFSIWLVSCLGEFQLLQFTVRHLLLTLEFEMAIWRRRSICR